MLATKVLASGVTHLTDARYFAAWEVDYLCFSLGASGGITLDYLTAMREWITGPECVAELGGAAGAAGWPEALRRGNVATVLLDFGTEAAPFVAAGLSVIFRLPVAGYHAAEDIADLLAETDGRVVLDFTDGGITWHDLEEGSPFDLPSLQRLLAGRAVFLRIDLGGRDAKQLVAGHGIFGLAVRGSSEEKVGYKSFDDLDDLFENLEV